MYTLVRILPHVVRNDLHTVLYTPSLKKIAFYTYQI